VPFSIAVDESMHARLNASLEIVYLLRHGETEYNRADRFDGRLDSPLTDRGIKEARRHGRTLRGLIDHIDDFRFVSSPLGRALHTARIISEALGRPHAEIETEERLTEIDFGAWDGLTLVEIEQDYGTQWQERNRDEWHYRIPGGESYAMVARRVESWMGTAHGRLIVVTHGAVERILRGLYAGMSNTEILALDEPQDILFRLEGGQVHRY
jgi:broad specificity phosphatase PhoE